MEASKFFLMVSESGQGWTVARENYRECVDGDRDFIQVTRQVNATNYPLRAAVALQMQLNGSFWTTNPVDVAMHFFELAATTDTGSAKVMADVLLGLYNGHRFKFDLTELCRLDERHRDMALCLIAFDSPRVLEIHELLNEATNRKDFGQRFEWLAWRMGRLEQGENNPYPSLKHVTLPIIEK